MDNFQSQGVNSKNNNGAYPNDPKVWAFSEAALKGFFVSNPQKIYQNFLGLVVYCATQKSAWEWREYIVDETTTKLFDDNFVYPSNYPSINEVTYASKVFNFFKKPTTEEIFAQIPGFANVGDSGIGVYQNTLLNVANFKKIDSDNFLVTEVDTPSGKVIKINPPADTSFQGTDFYVNNAYTGDVETGTQARPFKTLVKCVDKILNRGSQNDPDVNGGDPYEKWEVRDVNSNVRVIIQSYSETSENLAINRVTYFLERGGFESMIQLKNGSSSDRIIDMKELVDDVPKVAGKLPFDITCALLGKGTIAIEETHTTRKGFFRGYGHSDGNLSVDQPDSLLQLGDTNTQISCIMYKLPSVSYINLTNDRKTETFTYSGSMPIVVTTAIVSINQIFINGSLVDPGDYSFVGSSVTITDTINPGDAVLINYTVAPENIIRELTQMEGNQTTSVPDYGAVEVGGANSIFGQSLFFSGDFAISCFEQHMIYGTNKGKIYGEEGSIYLRRSYQKVNYDSIEYIDIMENSNTDDIRKFYTPSKHVSDIHLENGADFSYAGQFITQENTGYTQGGSEAFVTLISGTGPGELSGFNANGGGVIFQLFYNHHFKIINHTSFGSYTTSNLTAKNLRMESPIFEDSLNVVDQTGADYTEVIYPFVLFNCKLENRFVHGYKRISLTNMIINNNLIIQGGLLNLPDTIMTATMPNFTNNAAAVTAKMPIGSHYKDDDAFIKIVE